MSADKKNLLVITSNFAPEHSGLAVYTTDFALNVIASKFNVTVLTGMPHYPWWKIPEAYSDIRPGVSSLERVTIHRVNHYIPTKHNAFNRIRYELSFWRSWRKKVSKLQSLDFDLVISFIPTVASGLIAHQFKRQGKMKMLLIAQDLSSLATLESGIPGAPLFYKLTRWLERLIFSQSDAIIVVSEEMKRSVETMFESERELIVIHNYSLIEASTLSSEIARTRLGEYKDKFLLMHTGNIGYKQDLMNIVKTAKILESVPDVAFIIMGHGNQEEIIRRAIEGCPNICLKPFVPANEYSSYLRAADVLLLNERKSLKDMCLPSKLTSYLLSGRPIIAAISKIGATGTFLTGKAIITEPESPEELANAILELKRNLPMGRAIAEKGEAFAKVNLNKENSRKYYLEIIEKLTES